MPSPTRPAAVFLALLSFAASAAQLAAVEPAPHLRAETLDARVIIEELLARSATARGFAERLQQRDVLVYVRLRWFTTDTINGHVGVVRTSGAPRLLVVELACRRTRQQQLAALGHELRHAVEIADAPSIVDATTLAAFYRRIGESVAVAGAVEAFETAAAVDAGRRVRAELAARQ
jgi:hypothetical protein